MSAKASGGERVRRHGTTARPAFRFPGLRTKIYRLQLKNEPSTCKQHMWEGWSPVMRESCDHLNHRFGLFTWPSRRPRVSERG